MKNEDRKTTSSRRLELLETGKFETYRPDREMIVGELVKEIHWDPSFFGVLVNGKKASFDMRITPNDEVIVLPYIMGGAGKQGLISSIQNIFNGELAKNSRRKFHNIEQFSVYLSKDGNADYLNTFIEDSRTQSEDILKEITELMYNIYHVDSIFSLQDRNKLSKLKLEALEKCNQYLKDNYEFSPKAKILYDKLYQELFIKGNAKKIGSYDVMAISCDLIGFYDKYYGIDKVINELQEYFITRNDADPSTLIDQLTKTIWRKSYTQLLREKVWDKQFLSYDLINEVHNSITIYGETIKVDLDNLIGITKGPVIEGMDIYLLYIGKHNYLTDAGHGLEHIIQRHLEKQFTKWGYNSDSDVYKFILENIRDNPNYKFKPDTKNKGGVLIYKTVDIYGNEQYLWITISSRRFIVTSYPLNYKNGKIIYNSLP